MSCTQLGHLMQMYGFGKLGFPSKDRANGVSHVLSDERDALHFVLIYLAISCLGPSLHVMIDACLAQTAVLADTLRFSLDQAPWSWESTFGLFWSNLRISKYSSFSIYKGSMHEVYWQFLMEGLEKICRVKLKCVLAKLSYTLTKIRNMDYVQPLDAFVFIQEVLFFQWESKGPPAHPPQNFQK